MTVTDRVHDILFDMLNVDPFEIKPTDSFVDDLEADSLDLVELVMAAEEEFEVSILDEDAEKLITVGDAVEYIEGALKVKEQP